MKKTKLLLCLLIATSLASNAQHLPYPTAHQSKVEDTYFGVRVADPYRWMEEDQSPEVLTWTNQENQLTNSYLAKIPFRDTLKQRMTALWNYPKYTPPFFAGTRYFYYKNDGLQNQPMLFMMKSLQYVPMEYFDPNKLSQDGTTAISQTVPSMDGRFLRSRVTGAHPFAR